MSYYYNSELFGLLHYDRVLRVGVYMRSLTYTYELKLHCVMARACVNLL